MESNLRPFPISQWRGSEFDPHRAAVAFLSIQDRAERKAHWWRHLSRIANEARRLGGLEGEALEQALRDYAADVQAELDQIREDLSYAG